jgi:16S rRNA (uracil1498-N3)-methyltransferase
MHRFFVPDSQIHGKDAVITGDDVIHMKKVLRMQTGEEVVLSDGKGYDYDCTIKEIGDDKVYLWIKESKPAVSELPVKLVLIQALPKSDKMDGIIQKAVELGVYELIPVRTSRSVVRLEDRKAAKKQIRWQAIAEAAAKQSGRGMIPKIHPVMSMEEAIETAKKYDTILIPYELADNMSETGEIIKSSLTGKSIAVIIGPEGGFERGEVEKAVEAGAKQISLGKRILRTETAGMMILSVLMFQIEKEQNSGSLFG